MRSRKRALPRISTGRLRPPSLTPIREAPARPDSTVMMSPDVNEETEDTTEDSVVVGGITEATAVAPRPQDSACRLGWWLLRNAQADSCCQLQFQDTTFYGSHGHCRFAFATKILGRSRRPRRSTPQVSCNSCSGTLPCSQQLLSGVGRRQEDFRRDYLSSRIFKISDLEWGKLLGEGTEQCWETK
jgi:hypothetical protein